MNSRRVSFVKIAIRALKMQFKLTPILLIIFTLVAFLEAFGLIIRIKAIQDLFDIVTKASFGQIGFDNCLKSLLIMMVVTFIQQIMNGIKFFLWEMIPEKSERENRCLLFRKLQKIYAEQFENPSFLDNVNKASEGIVPLTTTCLFIINLFFFSGTYVVFMGMYLFNLEPILLFTILIAFVPAIAAQIFRVKFFSHLEDKNAPLRREYEYYKSTLCGRKDYKETRILGAFSFFYKLFRDTLFLFTYQQWRVERKVTVMGLFLNIISFVGMGISTYLLFLSTLDGNISVGAFAAVFSALGQIFDIMQSVFRWDANGITREVGKVTNFFRILDLHERVGNSGVSDFSKGIVAEHISFTYPGGVHPALNDVSLTIQAGETIAVVGENGSGKSTLTRLLTGIYIPQKGKVVVGGLDTSLTSSSSIYNNISAIFQEYQRYKMTLMDNVTISDTKAKCDVSKVKKVLNDVDFQFNYNSIPLDTMLSPEFDGIDLSGGQWQRLAIARGLYRTNKFIILDEPTASIDPLEENEIFTQFKNLIKGKCAIIVTHRLGAAKLANRIIVMDAGKIVDIGTHDELLSHSGKYSEMWSTQAKWYKM